MCYLIICTVPRLQAKRIKGEAWVAANLPLDSIGLSLEADPVRWAMFDTVSVANARAVLLKKSTVRKADVDMQMKRMSLMGDRGIDDDRPEDPAEAAIRETAVSLPHSSVRVSSCVRACNVDSQERWCAARRAGGRVGGWARVGADGTLRCKLPKDSRDSPATGSSPRGRIP